MMRSGGFYFGFFQGVFVERTNKEFVFLWGQTRVCPHVEKFMFYPIQLRVNDKGVCYF
ncbi:hypothetical protein EV282_0401 [Fictibacillus sp. BK138]|nr:hypothetical protein EV282_0401 [Fictibacillus sp. BK138]